MGSTIRVNDTLQITAEQGFPQVLSISNYLESPFTVSRFAGTAFSFQNKEGIRNFQQPPVQNFLVENHQGKHIYWGLITMLRVSHDYSANVTSGEYRLHTLYTLEQMKMAATLTGLASDLDYFSSKLYAPVSPDDAPNH